MTGGLHKSRQLKFKNQKLKGIFFNEKWRGANRGELCDQPTLIKTSQLVNALLPLLATHMASSESNNSFIVGTKNF